MPRDPEALRWFADHGMAGVAQDERDPLVRNARVARGTPKLLTDPKVHAPWWRQRLKRITSYLQTWETWGPWIRGQMYALPTAGPDHSVDDQRDRRECAIFT